VDDHLNDRAATALRRALENLIAELATCFADAKATAGVPPDLVREVASALDRAREAARAADSRDTRTEYGSDELAELVSEAFDAGSVAVRWWATWNQARAAGGARSGAPARDPR